MKKYRLYAKIKLYPQDSNPIKEVEIEKETDKFVYIVSKYYAPYRAAKKSEDYEYFDTLEEAKAVAVKYSDALVEECEKKLNAALSMREKLDGWCNELEQNKESDNV